MVLAEARPPAAVEPKEASVSLVQIFVDAYNKALAKNKKPEVDVKSLGTMGSIPEGYSKSFDPLRPAPESEGQEIDHGAAPGVGGPDVGTPGPDKPPAG
jgi:hypothetical protein